MQRSPMNTTVWLRDGKCEAWYPTQDGEGAQESIAKTLGIPKSDITAHVTFMGGGFERRVGGPSDRQAIQVAQRMKLPVQLCGRARTTSITTVIDLQACIGFAPVWTIEEISLHGQIVSQIRRSSVRAIQSKPRHTRCLDAVDMPYPASHIRVSYVPVESDVPRGAGRAEFPSHSMSSLWSALSCT